MTPLTPSPLHGPGGALTDPAGLFTGADGSPARPGPVRIRRNDYGVLAPPAPGAWEPSLSVSVVIPARNCQAELDLLLAALAAQSYPDRLLEVIVVDDGSGPPLRLPPIAPSRTRLVPARPGGWGIAWALDTGTALAEGHVIHRVDADMVPYREHVEAHMRWHHLCDHAVVLGTLRFADVAGGLPAPPVVRDALAAGEEDGLFDLPSSAAHDWWEELVDRYDGFRHAPSSVLHRVHVGATASLPAELLRAAGGLDTSLVLAEDTELGYRLTQAGAVFVPDRAARSWHLGKPTAMLRGDEVRRHNAPFVADRVPYRRFLRVEGGRQWLVPYVEVLVDASAAGCESVSGTVDSALVSTLPDVHVTVTGPWDALDDGRRAPLDDPLLDLRLVRGRYAHDGRVRFAVSAPATAAPAPFRLVCPPGWGVAADTVDRLVAYAEEGDLGLLCVALDEGEGGVLSARLERTSSVARAVRLAEDGESLDDVIHETFGSEWLDGETWGFVRLDPAARLPRSSRNTEAAHWKALAVQRKIDGGRLRSRVTALEKEVARLRKEAEKGRRDTERWRAKAEQWRVEAVRLRRERDLTVLRRAVRKARRLLRDRDDPAST
ncbi:glycosyltransferase [Microtetraspora niveoalba]|uniref:glycosyltransferase n=1 Tax=Microtetraspora niveoalba TaxID=46175 RepID=UPI000A03A755|nr:glycosyltransferase [Microtetraspora niveoalba]